MEEEKGSSDFLKINEAARYLGVTRRWIYRRIWSGELSASKVGGFYFIHKQDLEALITKGKTGRLNEQKEKVVPPVLKCGYCFRLLESDSQIGDVCEAENCDELICTQCLSENIHRCVKHVENRQKLWERALEEYRQGDGKVLVSGSQARMREVAFLQRLHIRLSGISTVRHPLSDEILTVKTWEGIIEEGDERAEIMKLVNKAVLETEWLTQVPLNAYARFRLPNLQNRTLKGLPLVVLAQVLSRPTPMLQKGFDTEPIGVNELSTYLLQVGTQAYQNQEFTLVAVAATTGWDDSARNLIQGDSSGAFSHRWMLVYLTDLETRELIYNHADGRTRDYVELFNPLMAGEEIEEVTKAVEKEMGFYSSLTLQSAMEVLPYPSKSIERAFETLAASGRFVLTEVDGLGRAIVRS